MTHWLVLLWVIAVISLPQISAAAPAEGGIPSLATAQTNIVLANRGTANRGTANRGTANRGTAIGGTENGGTANWGTENR